MANAPKDFVPSPKVDDPNQKITINPKYSRFFKPSLSLNLLEVDCKASARPPNDDRRRDDPSPRLLVTPSA